LVDHDQYQAKLDPELPAIAALNGSVRALEKLHRIGADGNKPDVYGWTPLALTKLLQETDVGAILQPPNSVGRHTPERVDAICSHQTILQSIRKWHGDHTQIWAIVQHLD
jgi:hypothetical protein